MNDCENPKHREEHFCKECTEAALLQKGVLSAALEEIVNTTPTGSPGWKIADRTLNPKPCSVCGRLTNGCCTVSVAEKPVDNMLMMTCGDCGEEHHRTFMPHHKLNCPQKRKCDFSQCGKALPCPDHFTNEEAQHIINSLGFKRKAEGRCRKCGNLWSEIDAAKIHPCR